MVNCALVFGLCHHLVIQCNKLITVSANKNAGIHLSAIPCSARLGGQRIVVIAQYAAVCAAIYLN